MEYGLIALWLGYFLALGALALPLTGALLGALPDRGAGLSISVAFAVLAVVGYWVGQFQFGRVAAVASVLVLGIAAGLAHRSGVRVRWDRYRDAAIVFALSFLVLVAIRSADPGAIPGGGEKFLDFGLLSSLLRTRVLPPEDVWFANEPVRYYYGGHMLAAIFALLLDTTAEYAYNLALAGFYAAYVTAAWGLGGAVAAGRGWSYRRGGAMAAFFVGIASNLSTPVRLLLWIVPSPLDRTLSRIASVPIEGLARGPMTFDYWLASRSLQSGAHLITEFPFFAFLNGDLHAHMMSPAILLLGAGIALAYWRTPPQQRWRRRGLLLVAAPPILGLLVLVNTWSAPTFAGIVWLTVLFDAGGPWRLLPRSWDRRIDAWLETRRPLEEGVRALGATAVAVAVAVLGVATVLPFVTGTMSGRSIGFLPAPTSALPGLLLVHGGFLAVTAGYLLRERDHGTAAVAGLVWVGAIGLSTVPDLPAVGLFVPPLLAAWSLLRTDGPVGFETVLAVGAFGLLIIVEFVYVVEAAAPGRFNTLFKVYAQVWGLWSVAAGAMAASAPPLGESVRRVLARTSRAIGRLRRIVESAISSDRHRGGADASHDGSAAIDRGTVASALLALLVVLTSVYTGFGAVSTIGSADGEFTLDATDYVSERHPGEAAAIEWLDDREGQPTLVSAPGTEIYRWVNAPSSLTGIPTVAGWSHEVGYRGAEAYRFRVEAVEGIYETEEARSRANLLRFFDVEYVYVGPIERRRYDVQDYGEEPGIRVAFDRGRVTIYRVIESRLVG